MTCSALQSLDPGRKKAAAEDGRFFLFSVFTVVFPYVLFSTGQIRVLSALTQMWGNVCQMSSNVNLISLTSLYKINLTNLNFESVKIWHTQNWRNVAESLAFFVRVRSDVFKNNYVCSSFTGQTLLNSATISSTFLFEGFCPTCTFQTG